MKIAIIGGGIAGLAAVYELNLLSRQGANLKSTLFEANSRLGGTVETERCGDFVLECGPDGWITEKPWARALAEELGLGAECIASNDAMRRTYVVEDGQLVAMPAGMRMMVPTQWEPLVSSPLFSWQAKLAYLREPKRAEELKALASGEDFSVSEFVRRHFGDEVTEKLAGPLLAGVFGGAADRLSARAVMGNFVEMEREHGSLILGLQRRAAVNGAEKSASIFTSLKNGLGSMVDAIEKRLDRTTLLKDQPVLAIERLEERWMVRSDQTQEKFDAVILAVPAHIAKPLLAPIDWALSELHTIEASNAITVALAYSPSQAAALRIPRGFGFLVPQKLVPQKEQGPSSAQTIHRAIHPALLACTFVDQKYAHRAPPGAVVLRVFFGGSQVAPLLDESDDSLSELARCELAKLLGPLPNAQHTALRRWPRSLPQYEVGHLARVDAIESRARLLPNFRLVGNAYRGVGLPDLIRDGRAAARELAEAK